MKNLFFILIYCVICTQYAFSENDCDCLPDEEGMYHYYVNLKEDNVRDDFSKENLLSVMKKSKSMALDNIQTHSAEIKDAFKSFPTAHSKFLQKTITIKSYDPDLDTKLGKLSDVFNLIEKNCFGGELASYHPNDYAIGGHAWKRHHLDLVRAPEAWEIAKGDPRILIGIVDTYIDENHEELKDKIAVIRRNIYPDNNNNPGHGTQVAGFAAGHTDNSKGLAAIGFNCKIAFSSTNTDTEVLFMAQVPGVRVINRSWGQPSHTSVMDSLYREVRDIHNVVVVASAGNGGTINGGASAYRYPASYESVISVTSVCSTNQYGVVHPQSGKFLWKDCHEATIGDKNSTFQHNDKVNICAPGFNLYTTDLGNTYAEDVKGTSLSAPMVAGVCALIASINPCLSAVEIKDIVLSTTDPTLYTYPENSDYIGLLGTGRLDAYAAVKKAVELGTKYIQNKTYNTSVTETAETEIKAGSSVSQNQPSGAVTINTGANVIFRATRGIELLPGFEVKPGASFSAEIYESPCF